jgi:hypothetical protein
VGEGVELSALRTIDESLNDVSQKVAQLQEYAISFLFLSVRGKEYISFYY